MRISITARALEKEEKGEGEVERTSRGRLKWVGENGSKTAEEGYEVSDKGREERGKEDSKLVCAG